METIKRLSSFFYLNVTQSLVVLNDSIFRLIVAYSLIDFLGVAKSNRILSISAALFVAPFLLFSLPAGQLADKFSKRSVILFTLWAEIAFMIFAMYAVYTRDVFSTYCALFLIALQSSVFSPSKYSILPEIEPIDKISKINGIMTLCTYLSIILGTFLASFLSEITHRNYTFVVGLCLIFSIVALFTGFKIEKTPVKNPDCKINPWFLLDIVRSLKEASKHPHLLLSLFASAYFLFTAAFTQLNLIPFGIQSLKITDVQTGYVYLGAALGMGIGSLLVSILSGKTVELGLSIWGSFGTAFSYILLYFVQHHLFWSCVVFISIGMHGGLYVVPLDAYMQVASPEKDRGSIIAAGTFLSFVAVLLSSGILALFGEVLKMQAATGFLCIGFLTLAIALCILFSIPQYCTRLFGVLAARFFFILDIEGKPDSGLVVSKSVSKWSYVFSLVYSFQRIKFIRVFRKVPTPWKRFFFKVANVVPVSFDAENRLDPCSQEILNIIGQNAVFVLFSPEDKYADKVAVLKNSIQKDAYLMDIHRVYNEDRSHMQFFRIFHPKISMRFSPLDV